MNSMFLALQNVGLVQVEAPVARRDYVAESLQAVEEYVPSETDKQVFRDLAQVQCMPEFSVIQVKSASVFNELGYDFDSPVQGALIRGGNSFLTISAFNEMFLKSTQFGKKLNVIPGKTSGKYLTLKVVDLDQIGAL